MAVPPPSRTMYNVTVSMIIVHLSLVLMLWLIVYIEEMFVHKSYVSIL